MQDTLVVAPEDLYEPEQIAGTVRNTPLGYVPGRLAGLIVGDECLCVCSECSTIEERGNKDNAIITGFDEWDYGVRCERCTKILETHIIVYEGSEEYEKLTEQREWFLFYHIRKGMGDQNG